MDISSYSAQLLSGEHSFRCLPLEVVELLRLGTNAQYLDTLVQTALQPIHTGSVFATHEPIFVELCSRFLTISEIHGLSALAALARVLPLAPHLTIYARTLLEAKRHDALAALASERVDALLDLPFEKLHALLLALRRLLTFDNYTFASFISPAQFQLLLKHPRLHIRYLSAKVFCLYLHASDATLLSMVKRYIGEDAIQGPWEDIEIDYIFLSLWEDKRLKKLGHDLRGCQDAGREASLREGKMTGRRVFEPKDFSSNTAYVEGVLLPRLNQELNVVSSIVITKTVSANIKALATGIRGSMPLLLTGLPGAGKSSLVKDLARELGTSSAMTTLHLNEQTDAKLLLGMYTCQTPGSLTWRPGVLTTAVMEGRWVLIEDLDRAPSDIISTLLPLLERGELLVPQMDQTIRAAPGFKIIATVRSSINGRSEEHTPVANIIGIRLWHQVHFNVPTDAELAYIVTVRYPILRLHLPNFMAVYHDLRKWYSSLSSTHAISYRPPGPQDLLKWCSRVDTLLRYAGVETESQPIPEPINDSVFLEAVDCFAGAIPTSALRSQVVGKIARGLHIPAERASHCLIAHKPDRDTNKFSLRNLPRPKSRPGVKAVSTRSGANPFALTNHVRRLVESVLVAVKLGEPTLLVGETGTGKTTIVQWLADRMDRKLTVVNLSQQSEAGDLLGGFKPVNTRSLAMPLKDEFDDLIGQMSSSNQNQQFLDTLGKCIAKSRWQRALALWEEALRTVAPHMQNAKSVINSGDIEQSTKRRKLHTPKYSKLKGRWEKFASDVQAFHRHLSSGSKGFAFSFLEGNIVNAARDGNWVLLDEINLASPDTLESLADLFSNGIDEGPFITLTETGDPDKIQAHKNFRIFGAMNPATDIGKRDLPLSLRSKFTEFFVEAPDKDLRDLVEVVEAYLGKTTAAEVRAVTEIAKLYLEIKRLVDENLLVDGANQKPHFSLRTLSRTLTYVLDVRSTYGLDRALIEGFYMSFLSVLNGESKLLLQPLIDRYILGSRTSSRAVLNQPPGTPRDKKCYIPFMRYWVAQGDSMIEKQPHYIITPFIQQNFLNLVRATLTRKFPVLLQGPTSSGKTSMIEYFAGISGNKFVRINNHEHTDLQEYLGTYVSGPDGQLHFQEGILVQALREGYWVVLDELNLAPTDVLEALNRLLDDNRELLIPETQQIVRPHENFMLFATQNPAGVYGGRKILSRAFRNRFLELHFDDIPEEELETILRERSQIAPSFCKRIVAVYKKLSILRQSGQSERLFESKNSFATLRDLFRWALRKADFNEQLAINGFFLLAERVRDSDERLAIKGVIETVMKFKIDLDEIYDLTKIRASLGTHIISPRGIVWNKSMRRLFVLVTESLKSNEPVLLIGETGSGKTTICQAIAELAGTTLHIVNAHQNMETGDLIGAQRPIRNRALVESQLAQQLLVVLDGHTSYDVGPDSDLSTLLEAYAELQRHIPKGVSDEARLHVEQSKIKANSLFEWADGSLVNAMKQGHHFLLDEISLADDSVLERLNSVLEPGRSLLLAEKGVNDVSITASPGFQFLATMNPGGDYGKRELSPALRNRFTEIWVPRASDEEEILEIILAKLAPPFTQYAEPMVEFAAWYSKIYGHGSSHLSIRDLLAWTTFVNKSTMSDPYRRLLHGALMVYVDGLGANPASKIAVADTAITKERHVCLGKLDILFAHDMSSLYNEKCEITWQQSSFSIGDFSIARNSETLHGPRYSLQAPTTTTNMMKILRALQIQKPILLEGSPGVGKTTVVTALAQAIGMPLTRINLSDQTDLMDLFGADVPIEGAEAGDFAWRDAPFLRAMQRGEWVLLDEMNLASQSILEGLNACLDHRGQVYVSELDQTFERHPNFVVFAAQNPHHQGGGRKGLPASFVNRFTLVYADILTAQDLTVITSDIYPQAPRDVTKCMLKAVDALSQLLHQDRRINADGGPWEINLRDLLRWLHLITTPGGLKPAPKAVDYLQLLFIQRFRSSDVIKAASNILYDIMPQAKTRTYYHSQSEHLIEIGLGFLRRSSISRPISGNFNTHSPLSLPLAESVMLCIESRWPCLLVGPSGCGKTQVIMQLAHAVGVDVVNLSLSSEMDTLDIIGGYEQLDPQRGIASFLNRVQIHANKFIVSAVASDQGVNKVLLDIETVFRDPKCEVTTIQRLLADAAKEYPSSDFPDFLVECQSLLERTTDGIRARFEWVDGVLIKALEQGKWVILDNANLCSPSVLDRLNSLLEPGGFLSINEHRNPDGSAKVVVPHVDFRIFMTMDPRHGEISRAMRNRSVELFMPLNFAAPKIDVLTSNVESYVFRFRFFQSFDWSIIDDVLASKLLSICLDHLSFQDFVKIHRWQLQSRMDLAGFTYKIKASLSLLITSYKSLCSSSSVIRKRIEKSYDNLADTQITSSGLRMLQCVHPYNNPVLYSDVGHGHASGTLQWLGDCFELLLRIHNHDLQLEQAAEDLESKDPNQMSKLEKSLIFEEDGRFQNESTRPLAKFFRNMGGYLRECVNSEDFMEIADSKSELSYVKEVVLFLEDTLDLSNSPGFDEGMFQVYQNVAQSIVTRGSALQSYTSRVADYLRSQLDAFTSAWQLSSGLLMEQLWYHFRPPLANSLLRLESSHQVKRLANRFDALKWKSGASVQELDILCTSIRRMHDSILSSSQDDEALEHVTDCIQQLNSSSGLSQSEVIPHFRSQFEIFCQLEACTKGQGPSQVSSVVSLLTERSTAQLMTYGPSSRQWSLLSQLQAMTASGSKTSELAALRNILPMTILQKLDAIREVPLQSVRLLSTEINLLGNQFALSTHTMSGDTLRAIDCVIEDLRCQIRTAVNISLGSEVFKSVESSVDQLASRLNVKCTVGADLFAPDTHLHDCLASIFDVQQLDHGISDIARTSSACVQLFTGCLLLYVPDRIFDPALKPIVERSRHKKRMAELRSSLQALQQFEIVYSGQVSSFRIQLVESELEGSGAEPHVSSVIRPQISELGQLQAEFSNLLKMIVVRSPSTFALGKAFNGHKTEMKDLSLLRENISQILLRFSSRFLAYEDITKPLIAFLQGLDTGLALALLVGNSSVQNGYDVTALCKETPFLGAGPDEVLNSVDVSADTQDNEMPERLQRYLKSYALTQSLCIDLGQSSVRDMCQAFQGLYEVWKENLDRDQQQNAAKSSLYRYRGGLDDATEAEELDFQQLFPNCIDVSGDCLWPVAPMTSPREQAQCLASLHRRIFRVTSKPSALILDMLRDAAHLVAQNWKEDCQPCISPFVADNLVSAVILKLAENKELLQDEIIPGRRYSFYADANLPEVQKLINLVHRIQLRFFDIREAWPEHMTLADVLRTSLELLSLRHTEPIAKLLTKSEQLHGFIHEWQVVASKQYTAISLYDELTNLLVSWRRLELSTWSRLLDMEDQHCRDDADAWWFVAYELIIVGPLSLVDALEDLDVYTERTLSTLSEFLASTSIGQYSHRLDMIDCFKCHLQLMIVNYPLLAKIHSALTNFLSFYRRFEAQIKESLVKGRQVLEKDVKEVLLLASWKDTNIIALRDSAKRSHHRLFKIIRKYRSLLAQSADAFLSESFLEASTDNIVSARASAIVEPAVVNFRAIEICQRSIYDWEGKPERFRKSTSTAIRMAKESQLPSGAIDGAIYIDLYSAELKDSIKALQKETPSNATAGNVEHMKHLKARKRKLYSETLKDLRRMGFRSNVDAPTLAKQASISTIFASNPALVGVSLRTDVESAEYYFHKLLNILPSLKEQARTHSNDLTNGEVSRSLGYLENMISLILKQRETLASDLLNIDRLQRTTERMENMWAPDDYTVGKQTHQNSTVERKTHCILKWLPSILEAGLSIVQEHGRLGGDEWSTIVQSLSHWKDRFVAMSVSCDKLVALPIGLSSSQHRAAFGEAEKLLDALKVGLQQLVAANPRLAFVLQQIELWTKVGISTAGECTNGETILGLEDFENSISGLVDMTLVTIQQFKEAFSSIPKSIDESAWLIRTSASLSASKEALCASKINETLEDAISNICYLDADVSERWEAAAALCAIAMPIIQEYCSIQQTAFIRSLELHKSVCKLASILAASFHQVAKDGFCSPVENEVSESEKTEKLEGGTGLGDGEGAEDISKDIEDDEDLSELAQQKDKSREREDIEKEKDAVNMDQEELEGDMGDVSDRGEEESSPGGDEEEDIDEETGNVDNLDPSAVDEKLWNGKDDKTEKDKEGSRSRGDVERKDEGTAEAIEKQEGLNEVDSDEAVDEEATQDSEEVAKDETERMDPHAQDEQTLDLPEEMHLDNIDISDAHTESGDSDIDAMSDVQPGEIDNIGQADDDIPREEDIEDVPGQIEDKPEDTADTETESKSLEDVDPPVDTDPSDDDLSDDAGLLQERLEDDFVDSENALPSDNKGFGMDADRNDEDNTSVSQAQASTGEKGISSNEDQVGAAMKDGHSIDEKAVPDEGGSKDDGARSEPQSQAFKKLGDALEKWHRQNRSIHHASQREADPLPQTVDDGLAQEFEHLPDDNMESDIQALGATTQEEASGLTKKGLDLGILGENEDLNSNMPEEEGANDDAGANEENDVHMDEYDDQEEQSTPGLCVTQGLQQFTEIDKAENGAESEEEGIDDIDEDLSTTHLQTTSGTLSRSLEEARCLWSEYESRTRLLSLSLTEQLRLILAPTQATKMRGDFRTGKRLNIKRIIPYIASQYKRDKIWMRRSIPSKRNYQIMLAVDDSKSMGETGSGQLAFESLALMAKSLSILEAGAICVLAFGSSIQLVHPFEKPFSPEAGAGLLRQFSFQQLKTDVRKLIADSLTLFREARTKSSNAGTDLWQLQLIISDGMCEDHEGIRKLVRQAQVERLMIVFVVVSALRKDESILEMPHAVFDSNATGDTQLIMKLYRDTFPFPFYVVVREVKELPGVLTQALRQWFSEIAYHS